MMTIKSILRNMVTKTIEWLPQNETDRGVRSPHLWIIVVLLALGTFTYYVDQTQLINVPPFNNAFFTTVHDIHRTLFLIPIVYAALLFRVRGSLITSFVFLCVVLPRGLLFSPYSEPLLRPLVFVSFAAFISLLIATQLNRIETETRARTELSAAYQELKESHQQLMESQEQLIHAEKLTLLGEISASLAHEANNPLSAALVFAKLLTRETTSDNFSKEGALDYLSQIDSALTRGIRLIQNFVAFGRQSPPNLRPVDINDIVNQALALSAHSAKGQNIEVIKELNPSLPKVMADSDQLQQVCINLILNAIQAMPEGGRLIICTSTNGNWLKVEVQDTGCGISLENMRKLFTPFFTTKEKGKGVGLGLAVCQGIMQRHQGKIEVQSKEGEGSTFTACLPLPPKEHEEKATTLGKGGES